MPERFEDAIKALRHIARGNGAVMRIADRIVAARERETKGVCEPITGELRGAMCEWGWDAEQTLAISGSDFTQLCDAIDCIHATLEHEYDELRMKFVNVNRHAEHVEHENAALKAELDRVLYEQEEHQHSISEVTVTVTPRLDWSAVVADLRELTALCERTMEDE